MTLYAILLRTANWYFMYDVRGAPSNPSLVLYRSPEAVNAPAAGLLGGAKENANDVMTKRCENIKTYS
mgnify:CR=1 FL=1